MDSVNENDSWQALAIPPICERLIGFSIPHGNVFLVVSYEGMHLVTLSEPVTVATDDRYTEYDCYDPSQGVAEYGDRRWNIIGLSQGSPILHSPQDEQLLLDADALNLTITKKGQKVWSAAFENFSGDWAAATFSPDGRFVLLGCPYGIDFRIWRRR